MLTDANLHESTVAPGLAHRAGSRSACRYRAVRRSGVVMA